jgi:hypothetical protein
MIPAALPDNHNVALGGGLVKKETKNCARSFCWSCAGQRVNPLDHCCRQGLKGFPPLHGPCEQTWCPFYRPQHFLNFLPLPQGQVSFLPTLIAFPTACSESPLVSPETYSHCPASFTNRLTSWSLNSLWCISAVATNSTIPSWSSPWPCAVRTTSRPHQSGTVLGSMADGLVDGCQVRNK